jgi:hypothetical protein
VGQRLPIPVAVALAGLVVMVKTVVLGPVVVEMMVGLVMAAMVVFLAVVVEVLVTPELAVSELVVAALMGQESLAVLVIVSCSFLGK